MFVLIATEHLSIALRSDWSFEFAARRCDEIQHQLGGTA